MRFTYKGKNYRVDDSGYIYEDSLFGSKVGKIKENGDMMIREGFLEESRGRISYWTGDIFEKGIFGGEKKVLISTQKRPPIGTSKPAT